MEYTICVGNELDSIVTQTRYSIAKHHFFSVLEWNIRFVWVLSRTQQSHKHDIPLQNTIFLVFWNGIYDLCGYWVGLNSHTNTIFHCKTPFFSVLQWNIRFVWVLSWTQQPNKHDIPFQNTIFLAFCDGIYDMCGYWLGLNSHTNTIFHCKTPFF